MRIDQELNGLSITQHGVVAIWQIRALGASPTEVTRLRRSSQWVARSRRVLLRAGVPETAERVACAAVLEAGPDARLASVSAAALWTLGAWYRLLPAWVMADRDAAAFAGDVGHIYQRRGIPDRWTTTFNGIPVVRPELCIYQLCGHVHPRRAERALDTALSMGLVTVASLRSCLSELRRRGRNGTSVFDELLAARPLDYVALGTNLEARFVEVVGGSWRRQVDSGGEMWAGRVDFRHRVHPVIVEVQSARYHAALSFREDDEARRAKLEKAGFVVAEVWDQQLWHAPDEARSIVTAAIRRVQGAA